MNEVENDLPAKDIADLQAECAGLRQQAWVLLVLLVVISGTLTIYLLRQAVVAHRDLAAVPPQMLQLIQQYQKESPGIDEFVKKLAEYGRTRPDFQPILQKYGIPLPASPAPAPPKK